MEFFKISSRNSCSRAEMAFLHSDSLECKFSAYSEVSLKTHHTIRLVLFHIWVKT